MAEKPKKLNLGKRQLSEALYQNPIITKES